MTDQAIAYVRRMAAGPWVLHPSYVKPHWPYMAPAPYHAMYRAEECLPVVRSAGELAARIRSSPPTGSRRSASASSATTASAPCARPTRGPITSGRPPRPLFDALAGAGGWTTRFVVFAPTTATSSATTGWAKGLFYDAVQGALIVVDPRRADATAAAWTRASSKRVDIVPTVLDTLGMPVPSAPPRRREPRAAAARRRQRRLAHASCTASWDYAYRHAAWPSARRARVPAFSLRDDAGATCTGWASASSCSTSRPTPTSSRDLGADEGTAADARCLRGQLLDFLARRRHRTDGERRGSRARHRRVQEGGRVLRRW